MYVKLVMKRMKFNASLIRGIAAKFYFLMQRDYNKHNGKQRMLVAYLSEPFFRQNDKRYMSFHQNRRETIMMSEILDEMNLSYKFTHFQKPGLNAKGYDIVFGLEPIIDKAAEKNPTALKIYYATGAYVKHQNNVIKSRTDEFNNRTGSSVPYYRLVPEHMSSENSDAIIQIGSKYTIATYPENLRKKIKTIRQSCENFSFPDFIDRKVKEVRFDEYVWMGSKGSILKGLDLVLEYFRKTPHKTLNIIGEVDPEVMRFYEPLLKTCTNIHFHGFCRLDSPIVESIALKSGFVIMPSASEGCPGAVVNMMKLGCIPIVTPCAAFDEIKEYGQLIDGFTPEHIEAAVAAIDKLGEDSLRQKVLNCYKFANDNWNDESFKTDFRNALQSIINERDT